MNVFQILIGYSSHHILWAHQGLKDYGINNIGLKKCLMNWDKCVLSATQCHFTAALVNLLAAVWQLHRGI